MNIKCRFTFKPVQQSQRLLVHNWIIQDHIKEWLHGDGLRNTIEDLDKFLREPLGEDIGSLMTTIFLLPTC